MNRTCFSMGSINLIKESNVDDRLKLLDEIKRTELVGQTSSSSSSSSSPLAVWKRKVSSGLYISIYVCLYVVYTCVCVYLMRACVCACAYVSFLFSQTTNELLL